jgi:3-deoxy-D-manno-octulosonate 8-phosphate phosphatase (KDO 8-P phosphatase)
MTHARRQLPESLARDAGSIPAEVANRIRLVVFDVDGVLTDAGVYQGRTASGEDVELKRFDIQDGLGLKLLEAAGVGVVLISGRVSPATDMRAGELKLEMYQDGGAQKVGHLLRVMERGGIEWGEVAMLADDIPDLAVLRRVGFRAAVANAQPEILEVADFVTRARGGHGAAREFCRAILVGKGVWDDLVEEYVAERGGPA